MRTTSTLPLRRALSLSRPCGSWARQIWSISSSSRSSLQRNRSEPPPPALRDVEISRALLSFETGWRLPPCHRDRRFILREPGRLHKHPDVLHPRQAAQGRLWAILVRDYILGELFDADGASCYNAFSRLDMRVQVYIPGTVESYCIDERGEKRVATDELWLETYLCSVLRAYSYADDGSGDTIKKIVGVRRFNPITSTESEHKFLDAAERLFFNGMFPCGVLLEQRAKSLRLAARVRS